MKVHVDWNGKLGFLGSGPSGKSLLIDAGEEDGGDGAATSPVETMLMAACACSGIDVVSILKKKRQEITSYRIELDEERGPKGEYPRPIQKISVKHVICGPDLDPAAVKQAVELSDTKYCTVLQTFMHQVEVSSDYEVREEC